MESNDSYLEYAKANKDKFISYIIKGKSPEVGRDAVFMAGSPGAGKSEVAIGLAENYDNHVIIDADYFRTQFPDYNGKNSSLFQKASSWLVEQAFRYVLDHGYSFILDATFAILSAEKNISRALKKHFRVTIFYVYQDPKIAWNLHKNVKLQRDVMCRKRHLLTLFSNQERTLQK